MAEEQKEKQSEDYQFINEKIVSRRRKKWRKRMGTIIFVICMAMLFGVVSRAVFLLSGDYLKKWFGIEEERQAVNLPKPTGQPIAVLSPTQKPAKVPSMSPTTEPTGIPTQFPKLTPEERISPSAEPSAAAAVTPEAENSPAGEPSSDVETSTGAEPDSEMPSEENLPSENMDSSETAQIELYLQLYESVRKVAAEVSDAFVAVEVIEQGVDWFQEIYEKRTRTTGLILGNDGVDLLILVGTEQFVGATSIEVTFGEVVIPGSIYSMDRGYGLAVISVPLKEIPEEILAGVEIGVLAETEDIVVGTPVIALGAPNGYDGSMEFGMITSLGSTVPVTDGEVAYFTTNITEYPQGYGFVVNLEGKIMGMISHTHKDNLSDGIFSAVSLDSIRGILIKLLNNAEWAYFGIRGKDVPKNLKDEYDLVAGGVYVSEVENASPALLSGVKAGDIILSVGGHQIEGICDFSDVLLKCSIREIVSVKVLRKAEDGLREMTLEVLLTGKKVNKN